MKRKSRVKTFYWTTDNYDEQYIHLTLSIDATYIDLFKQNLTYNGHPSWALQYEDKGYALTEKVYEEIKEWINSFKRGEDV